MLCLKDFSLQNAPKDILGIVGIGQANPKAAHETKSASIYIWNQKDSLAMNRKTTENCLQCTRMKMKMRLFHVINVILLVAIIKKDVVIERHDTHMKQKTTIVISAIA